MTTTAVRPSNENVPHIGCLAAGNVAVRTRLPPWSGALYFMGSVVIQSSDFASFSYAIPLG